VTRPGFPRSWVGPALFFIAIALVIAACAPGNGVDASGNPISPSPIPPLRPAEPGADPVSLMAWLFTPIFQFLFLILVVVYDVLEGLDIPGAIGWAIIVLTLVVRAILIPLYRKQLVSQRRMQLLAPEVKEIQRRFKGDRVKVQQAQQELFKERGVNPLSGCLPILLQLPLLFIMYTVIRDGLTNPDPHAMLSVFGIQLLSLDCTNVTNGVIDYTKPCIDTVLNVFGGLDVSQPWTIFDIPLGGFVLGISILALLSAILQFLQSRMMLPAPDPTNTDPNVRIQRQMMLFLPLISILYGGFLPAGLFIYWIVGTLFSIVQQYLIVGWGSTFPLLGRTPAFAVGHTPRFPVEMPPPPEPSKRAPILADATKGSSAEKTIRSAKRGRQGRRGRRR
jgi:YidC/Oxa1 family membrane protein insertase